MISFHLRSVPAEALEKYFAYRDQLHFEEYGYYPNEDENEDGKKLPAKPRALVEEFEMWELNETYTSGTSFEHNAEGDAKFLRYHGFSDLFDDTYEDNCSNPFTVQQTKDFLEEFKKFVEDSVSFQQAINDYYGDDKEQKEWINSLICERLIPFFELAVRDNEGFIAEWG